MRKRVPALTVWAAGLTVAGLGLSRRWLPPLASSHGAGVDRMLSYLTVTAGSMILAGLTVLGYFLWRFGGPELAPAPDTPGRSERRWTLTIAALVALAAEGGVFAVGFPVWREYFGTAAPANALTIEITAEQFAWNVRYAGPDGIFGRTDAKLITLDNPLGLDPADPRGRDDLVTLNVMHAIVGRPVRIRLRSKDVIHSFFLPNLRVKQDAMPGMTIELWFTPVREGRFELACSQLCGFGHYEMKGLLIVEPAADFERWTREQGNG
jgi:cytochrome c oxidase subunit 2